MKEIFLIIILFSVAFKGFSQSPDKVKKTDKDLIDVVSGILNTRWASKHDSLGKKSGRVYFSGAPSLGYSLTSGASAIFVGDFAFFASEHPEQKISIVYLDVLYTQKSQFVVRIQNNLWATDNKLNIVSDWRYYWYPQKTYGLGGQSVLENNVAQTYSYIRLHQTVLKSFRPNWYAGMGVAWDYHYDIVQSSDNPTVLD